MSASVIILLIGQLMTTEAEVVDEGRSIGRMSAALQVCADIGYDTRSERATEIEHDSLGRAIKAGWHWGQWRMAFDDGVEREQADLDLTSERDLPRDEMEIRLPQALVRVKARCRDLAKRYPGVIENLDEGDRRAEAQVAGWLR